MKSALYSSKSDEWETPEHIFNKLNNEFKFTLDVAASEELHKCPKFYTIADDGLAQSWAGERVFCNPPYSQISKWVKKCYMEHKEHGGLIVMLIPARTDTRYFHEYIYHVAEIRFIKGRIRFSNAVYNAPFPSMVVIFGGAAHEQ